MNATNIIKKFCKKRQFKILDNLQDTDRVNIELLIDYIYKKQNTLVSNKEILELLYSYFFKEKDELTSTWVKKQTIGKPGKEGTGYIVYKKGDQSIEYVMKEFKEKKSFSKVREEVKFQIIASLYGLSPVIYEYGKKPRPYIIMDKMNGGTIIDVMKKQNGILTIDQQKQLISIYEILDRIKVYHNDCNIRNLMFNNDKLYIIDFGMSRDLKNNESNFDSLNLAMITMTNYQAYLKEYPKLFIKYLKNDISKRYWLSKKPKK